MVFESQFSENEQKVRILIIEDDADFHFILRMHLSAAGYRSH